MTESVKPLFADSTNESEYCISRSVIDFEGGPTAERIGESGTIRIEDDEYAVVEGNAFKIARELAHVGNSWISVKASVDGIKQGLGYFEGSRGDVIQKAGLLQAQRDELRWKLILSQSFLSKFTLSEEDELFLASCNNISDGRFIRVINELQAILERCKIILGTDNPPSVAGEAITRNLIGIITMAFSRLCRLIPNLQVMRYVPSEESPMLSQVAVECLGGQEYYDPKELLVSIIKARSIGMSDKIESIVLAPNAKLESHINFCFLLDRSTLSLSVQHYTQGLEKMFSAFPGIYHSECETWSRIATECRWSTAGRFDFSTIITAIFSEPLSTIKRLLLKSDLINSAYFQHCPELMFRLLRSVKFCEHAMSSLNFGCNEAILNALSEVYELVNLNFKRHLVGFARHLKRTNVTISDNTALLPSKSIQKLESLMLYLCSFCLANSPSDKVNAWLIETTANYFLNLAQVFAAEECINLPSIYLTVYVINSSNHILDSLRKTMPLNVHLGGVKASINSYATITASAVISDLLGSREFPEQFRKLNHYCSHGVNIPIEDLRSINKSNLLGGLTHLTKLVSKHFAQALSPLEIISDHDSRKRIVDVILKHILMFYTSVHSYLDGMQSKEYLELPSVEVFKTKLEECAPVSS